jgi:hypothetical protein
MYHGADELPQRQIAQKTLKGRYHMHSLMITGRTLAAFAAFFSSSPRALAPLRTSVPAG